jgi:hypothetical protein
MRPLAFVLALLACGSLSPARTPSPVLGSLSMSVSALVGLYGLTEISFQLAGSKGMLLPEIAKDVQIKSSKINTKNFDNQALLNGQWVREFNDIPHGSAITVTVLVRDPNTSKNDTLQANTVALFRPDVTFLSVDHPTTASVGESLVLPVVIGETKGDLGSDCEIAMTGSAVDPVIASNVRVEAGGTTQLMFPLRFLQAGIQAVTLEIRGVTPYDYNPLNNSYTFIVNVQSSLAPTSWYGGYHRWSGVRSETYVNPDGSSLSQTSDGRSEFFHIVGMSDQPMSWPMNYSVTMIADDVPIKEFGVSGIMFAETMTGAQGPTEWIWLVDTQTAFSTRLLTETVGGVRRANFSSMLSAADYVYYLSQTGGGGNSTSLQFFGTFVNAERSVQFRAVLSSSLGAIGGDTGVLPITRSVVYGPLPEPLTGFDDRTIWDAYGSGILH